MSHETIYKTLYIQARGALKKELVQHLSSNRIMRRSRNSTAKHSGQGKIPDAVSISERPASVEDRAISSDLTIGSTFLASFRPRAMEI